MNDNGMGTYLWRILTGLNTAIILEYLSFRFHLAEKYVLKEDHQETLRAVFLKLDEIVKCQQEILLKLGEKADRR